MADNTGIEWTDATWNPIRGCTRVSEGCRNCYAERVAARFSKPGQPYHGLADLKRPGSKWTGKVKLFEPVLDQPLRWKRPRRIFVNSMSDLFHESVPDEWIDRIFAVMALSPQHTFQVLTKRSERMLAYMTEHWQPARAQSFGSLDVPAETRGETRYDQVTRECEPFLEKFRLADTSRDDLWTEDGSCKAMQWTWPLPNVWLGVSVENQDAADERIPRLLSAPAAIRFLSCEPLIGPIDLNRLHGCSADGREHWWESCLSGKRFDIWSDGDIAAAKIDWVIAGGESGPLARPSHPRWFRDLRDQCATAGVPYFFKQWGEWTPHALIAGRGLDREIQSGRVRVVHGKQMQGDAPSNSQDISVVEPGSGNRYMERVGKKVAGNTLDGRQHMEFPA